MGSIRQAFISAVSRELKECREDVRQVLARRGVMPVLQDEFTATHHEITEKLRRAIQPCNAVICLVGFAYGAEPTARPQGAPRHSYTQVEYDIARELGKPVYVFLTEDETAFPLAGAEADELRALQLAYRRELQSSDRDWAAFRTRERLREEVALLRFPWQADATGEEVEARPSKASETVAVLREEVLRNLGLLASQITHTRLNVPGGNPVPRRPGETREQFDDRDRAWFTHEVESIFSLYQQFQLEEAVLASQRVNLASCDERTRALVTDAYAALAEARNCVWQYRQRLQRLAGRDLGEGQCREELARLYGQQAANALALQWFTALMNFLMLGPDEADVQITQGYLLQALGDHPPPPSLSPGREGWQYAARQRARLHEEKMALDLQEPRLTFRPSSSPADATNRATDFADALGRASLAFLEGRAENAVLFLQQALQFPDVPEEHRHYARTSLEFLQDADLFAGQMGAYLLDIEEGGTAGRAELNKGDVIIRYNGGDVSEPVALARLVSQAKEAPLVPVEVVRGGRRLTKYLKGGASLCARATALVHVEPIAV